MLLIYYSSHLTLPTPVGKPSPAHDTSSLHDSLNMLFLAVRAIVPFIWHFHNLVLHSRDFARALLSLFVFLFLGLLCKSLILCTFPYLLFNVTFTSFREFLRLGTHQIYIVIGMLYDTARLS